MIDKKVKRKMKKEWQKFNSWAEKNGAVYSDRREKL